MPGRDLEWYGDVIVAELGRAAIAGTAATVDAAVAEARRRTPVDTGEARDNLRHEGEGREMTWGYHDDHGFFIEVGANGRPGVYALRGAADITYPRLSDEIARRFG